jgi:hypothetical protein
MANFAKKIMKRKEPSQITQKLLMNSLRAEYGDNFYYKYLENNLITQIIPKILGATLYSYLSQMKFENQTLYIKVNSAPLRSNLQMQRSSLIARLNEDAGVYLVKDIVFR